MFKHENETNIFIKFRDTPQTSKTEVKSIYAKTVLQISKILQIMTLSELSIHVFGENWLCSSVLISYESDYFGITCQMFDFERMHAYVPKYGY